MKRAELAREMILSMRIALAQENLHKGDEWLMEVAHPASDLYGKHWSAAGVAAAFAPRYRIALHTRKDPWLKLCQ
jgi:tripeptidyl-peptidase-1